MTASEFKTHFIPAYGAMLALAQRMLVGAADDADDVVQDVFRGLWEQCSELSLPANPVAFALRCVRNRCLDVLRRPERFVSLEGTPSVLCSVSDEEVNGLEERLVVLTRYVYELAEPRQTILRASMRGVSAAEIARNMGLSEANVRQILSRTRRELRNLVINKLRTDE